VLEALLPASAFPNTRKARGRIKFCWCGSSSDYNDAAPRIVGTAFSWDGDVLAEEAPLRLSGAIDWESATRWHFEPDTFRSLTKQEPEEQPKPGDDHWLPPSERAGQPHSRRRRLFHIVTDHLGTPREMCDETGDVRWPPASPPGVRCEA
jgi:hypothetical protein